MKRIVDVSDDEYEGYKRIAENYIVGSSVQKILDSTPLPECKNCRYFEYDSFARALHNPFIVAHEICKKWGDGCKTSEHGYCFLFEAKEGKHEDSD